MANSIEARLATLGIALPPAPPPAPGGSYVPYVLSGSFLFIAGQLPLKDGQLTCKGRVGADVSVEDAVAAARRCGLNIVAQVRAALDGDLDRVRRCLRVGGFVNATPEFVAHPQVVNGASQLFLDVFEDAGKHARFAVGVASLPLGAAVEVDAQFEVI